MLPPEIDGVYPTRTFSRRRTSDITLDLELDKRGRPRSCDQVCAAELEKLYHRKLQRLVQKKIAAEVDDRESGTLSDAEIMDLVECATNEAHGIVLSGILEKMLYDIVEDQSHFRALLGDELVKRGVLTSEEANCIEWNLQYTGVKRTLHSVKTGGVMQ